MNGYEATRKIRAHMNSKIANIPIIAMTADAFIDDQKEAIEAGMNGHLAKPIDINKLICSFEEFFLCPNCKCR